MPLETGNFICDLVETNPPGTDPVSQGDDHLRLIKHVLLTQFPNLCGEAVTATAEQLNNTGSATPPVITNYITPAAAQTHTFALETTWYKVTITGGGGGGTTSADDRGRGGTAGGTVIKTAIRTELTATFTVGAGGAVNAAGSDSTWVEGAAVNLFAYGGGPGLSAPGTVSGGDFNIVGGTQEGTTSRGTCGGGSFWGGPTMYSGAYGCGGRGQYDGGAQAPGMAGIIAIEEY